MKTIKCVCTTLKVKEAAVQMCPILPDCESDPIMLYGALVTLLGLHKGQNLLVGLLGFVLVDLGVISSRSANISNSQMFNPSNN